MNSKTQTHPQLEQLSAFAVGKLEPAAIDEIASHVEECEECRQTLREIPDDTFVTMVRDAHTISDGRCDIKPNAGDATILHTDVQEKPDSPDDAATIAPRGQAASCTQQSLKLSPELANHPRYDVVDLIGLGGMGSVYKAEHRMMQRTVALKVINQQFVSNQSAVNRFHREVQAAARLQHPNIVTAFDAEQAGETHFLVMEYVPGKDLDAVLKEKGRLSVLAACHFTRQVALGLQHAFEQGMVHRDIKPQNLMLTARNQVKILDFGLASLTGDDAGDTALTQRNAVMGTPDYIAPEQARDAHSADIRADIYSLGCTLYRLLTGQVPFPEGAAIDKIMAHVGSTPTPVNELRTELPAALVRILNKMMAKDPAERFQTPAEVAKALTPFAVKKPTTEPVTTPGAPTLDPSRPKTSLKETTAANRRANTGHRATLPANPPRRRWPLVVTLAAAASALVLLLGGIVLYLPTPNGVVRIEINDPKIKVGFNGNTYTFEDNKGETIKVTPGEHSLTVEHGDLKFETPKFTLGRGENPALRVEFVKGNLTVKVGDKLIDQRPLPPAVVAEKSRWALQFDEKEHAVALPFSLSEAGAHAVTAEAWVQIDAFPADRGHQNVIFAGWPAFILGLDNKECVWKCMVQQKEFNTKQPVSLNKATHVALVLEGRSARFFRDGELAATHTLAKPYSSTPKECLLGNVDKKTSAIHGKFLGVRLSKTARYTEKFTPQRRWLTDAATVALYHCDEGTGNVLKDSSGHARHGTIEGAKWVRVAAAGLTKAKDEITAAHILTSDEYEWTEPKNLGPKINSASAEVGPWVSADGLTLLFASTRAGGLGAYDLWQSTRLSVEEDWSEPVNLSDPINSKGFDAGATMSADGRTLVFISTRPGGQGNMDLWMATRKSKDAPWDDPVNLGAGINSAANDSAPILSDDGLQLFFTSNRGGPYKCWISKRTSVNDGWSQPELFFDGRGVSSFQPLDSGKAVLCSPDNKSISLAVWNAAAKRWGSAEPLPAPINDGNHNTLMFYHVPTNTLYFVSDRPGGQGETDLWMSRRVSSGWQ